MNTVLSYLSNLKLTLTQYILLTEAAIIGLLVLVLRAKGSELHKAQLDALEANYLVLKDAQDTKTSAAQKAYFNALKEYQENKQ